MTLIWWIASALAQSPPTVVDLDVMEVTVWGELAIDKAEDDIVRAMEGLGYRTKRKDGKVVFRPPRAWMGAAVFEDGNLRFRRPVAGFTRTPPETYAFDPRRQTVPGDNTNALSQTGGGPSVWVLPSRRRRAAVETEVRTVLAEELAWYHAVVARTALEDRIDQLPDRLDAVWSDGTRLFGDGALASQEARRKHVLEFWASRAATAAGRRVCGAVRAWLDAVIQTSDHPITDAERTAFEAQRTDGLRLP